MSTNTETDLVEIAHRLRRLTLKMIAASRAGHPGSSLSTIEILATLYYAVMRWNPANLTDPDRDRFVLSKGHAAPALYAVLVDQGVLAAEQSDLLRACGSQLQGHPDIRFTPGLDCGSGSLGQGASIAVGMAIGLSRQNRPGRVFALLGDGECQEGQVWEAAMLAGHLGLHNLCFVIDNNGIQHDGRVSDIVDVNPLAGKFAAFGWEISEVDGHDCGALLAAMTGTGPGPTAVIAKTVKGKGVSFMENTSAWHGIADPDRLSDALAEHDAHLDGIHA